MNRACSICGSSADEGRMQTFGDDVYVKKTYYCSDACWQKRGRIHGKTTGRGCPFYNEDRMCVPPDEGIRAAVPCNCPTGVRFTSCSVYPIHAEHRG